MDKLVGLLKSRKFWAAFFGFAIIVIKAFAPDFPISDEQLTNLTFIIVSYIIGVGISDVVPLLSKN